MSAYFPTAEELGRHMIFPGVRIRTCAAERMMLSLVDLEAGSVVAEHSHPHEQVGMVLAGRVLFVIGGEQRELGPGDFFRIPGGTPHRVTTLDQPARVLDIFTPIREEYL
jgi:quercetin dioxygenase-like cupin family protein